MKTFNCGGLLPRPISSLVLILALTSICAASESKVKVRPADWAQPVLNSTLDNFFRVSDDVYRSEQPKKKQVPELKTLGIRTLLSLRGYREDDKAFAEAGITLVRLPKNAGSLSVTDLVEVLKEVKTAEKPVLIHCWHGSDRTGFVVAGYRMVFQNWTRERAIEELRDGGYGYHAATYPNIVKELEKLDLPALKKAVLD